MKTGISTACFYPFQTDRALLSSLKLPVECCEVFINSPGEFSSEYGDLLRCVSDEYNIPIISVHPFTSAFEPMYFFSEYMRRFTEYLDVYKRYFEFTKNIGADFFILHGAMRGVKIPKEEIFERVGVLSLAAKSEGIQLLQENVMRCVSAEKEYISDMSRYLGDNIAFVLDVKQAALAGYSPAEMFDAMDGKVRHIHISDHNDTNKCMLIGHGSCDFKSFFQKLKRENYGGAAVLELYNHCYETEEQLAQSICTLKSLRDEYFK